MAEQFGIRLAISFADLLKSLNETIQKLNESKSVTKLKLGIDTNSLVRSIKESITEINASKRLESRPIALTASTAKLRDSLSRAIAEINKTGALSNKSININTKLNTQNLQKQIQSQISTATKQSGGTGYIGQLLKSPLDVGAINEQLKQENAQLTENNKLLKERLTNYIRTNDIVSQVRYGSKYNYFSDVFVNGQKEVTTHVVNQQGKEKELEHILAAAIRLQTELDNVKAKFTDINVAKPIKNPESLKELETQYKAISAEIDTLKTKSTEYSTQEIARIKSLIAELKRLQSSYANKEYAANVLRDVGLDTTKTIQGHELDAFIASINKSRVPLKKMESEVANLKTLLANVTDKNSLTAFLDSFDIARSKFAAIRGELETTASLSGKLKNALSQIAKMQSSAPLLKNISNGDVQTLFTNLNTLEIAKITERVSQLTAQLNEASKQSTALKNSFKSTGMVDNFAAKIQTLSGKIAEYMRVNTQAMKVINPYTGTGSTFGEDFQQLALAVPTSSDIAALNKHTQQFNTLTGQIKTLGLEGQSIFGELFSKGFKFIKWYGVTRILTNVVRYTNQLFTTVINLDENLIDLKKTFRGTNEELENFYYESNKIAKQMGVTTAEIIKQGAAWSRMSYSTNEVMQKMAEMSAMFAAISPDMNVEQAQNGLVSIIKAFGIDPQNVLDEVLSKVNIIGNTAATSNGEIVEMLEKSSAAMAAANNSLEQTISLGVAGVEILRDASKVGVALKSISMNIRSLDEETGQATGDVEELFGKIASYTKTASNPRGVSIFTDASHTTFRSTYAILRDISKVWNEISDTDQAELTNVLGGKYQGNVVAAILSNFDAAEKAMANMKDSAGSAEAEMETIRKSVSFALNELKTQFEELAQNTATRDFLKDLTKTGTGLLKVVTALVKTFGALPTIIGAVAGSITAFKKKGQGLLGYNDKGNLTVWGADTSNGLKSWYKEKTDPTGEKSAIKEQIKNVKAFDSAIKNNSMNMQTYNAVMKSSNDNVKRYGRAVMQGTDSTKAFKTINKQLKTELKQVGESTRTAADGTKELSVGMKLVNTASSILISMGISWAISKLIEGVGTMIKWADKYSEKATEAAEKSKSLKSQIEDVNGQLSDTKLKIAELNKLDNPTIIEQEELDRLLEVNKQLTNTKKSLEAMLRVSQNEAGEDTVEWFKTINYGGLKAKDDSWFTTAWKFLPRLWSGTLQDWNGKGYNAFLNAIYDFQKATEDKKELEELMAAATDTEEINELQKKIDKLDKDLENARKKADNNYSEWTAKIGTLDLENAEQKEIYDQMQELIGYWEYFSGKSKQELKDIVDDPNFTVVKDKLVSLWKDGKLTQETFADLTEESCEGIDAFRQALADNGYEDFAEIIRAICEYFKQTVTDADKATSAVKTFADAIAIVSEKMDTFLDKQKKLVEAFQKIELGGKLASEEIYELAKQFPELANEKYLKETADGWIITAEGISAASQKLVENEKKNLQEQVDEINGYIDTISRLVALDRATEASNDPIAARSTEEYNTLYEEAQKIRKKLKIEPTKGWTVIQSDLAEQVNGFAFLMEMVDDAFNKHNNALDGLKERYNDVKSEISDFNKQIQTVDNAIKTLGSGELLDYDELNELLDINSDLQYEGHENGHYSIDIKELEKLRKESYKTRNDYIDDIKARVQEEIEANKRLKNEYQDSIAKSPWDLGKVKELTDSIDDVNTSLEYLYNLNKKLEGWQQNLTIDDKEDNISDRLQQQIDYYKTIIDAVKAVKERYTKAIDNEIDVLQETKNALKENNDELQCEINLKEALVNLENAKKRKVWVYSEGIGFRQVQDQKAIKEAEEKYRDAITEIQVAEIDKEIKLREKQKEALEENTKALTELEQNIQDALTIEQAKADWGITDEKDFLNLPDSVKEEIKNGLTDAIVQKNAEYNKDNQLYKKVGLDDVLKSLGAKVTTADLAKEQFADITQSAYNVMSSALADAFKDQTDKHISEVVNNNNISGNTFNITVNEAHNGEDTAKVVRDEITDIFRRIQVSIK